MQKQRYKSINESRSRRTQFPKRKAQMLASPVLEKAFFPVAPNTHYTTTSVDSIVLDFKAHTHSTAQIVWKDDASEGLKVGARFGRCDRIGRE